MECASLLALLLSGLAHGTYVGYARFARLAWLDKETRASSPGESGSKLPHSIWEKLVGDDYRTWHHSPSHLFEPGAAYFVTAGIYQKQRLFDSPEKLDFLVATLFEEAERFRWELEAWAVMSNHYHFVATAPEDAGTLHKFIKALHSKTAIWLNRADDAPGRKVWFQYRDTCLTYQKSYLARLNYVHNNPVKHGLVGNAENYKWCSMAWFMNESEPGFRKTVLAMKSDRVNVDDDY